MAHLFNDNGLDRQPITKSTIYETVTRYRCISQTSIKIGKVKKCYERNKCFEVCKKVFDDSHMSIRKIAQQTRICKTSVNEIRIR